MTYTNYREMTQAIRERRQFEGNSVSAHYDGGDYVVKSYNTEMLRIGSGGAVKFNNRRYSVTTSKLQNMIIDTLHLPDSKKR